MRRSDSPLRLIVDPAPELAGDSAGDFLERLGGPTAFLFPGHDPQRTRAFITLLHGNEPSGVIALRGLLKDGLRPAVNLLCVVASVPAALEAPGFAHRMLPRARDLNRCFRPPFSDSQGELAAAILGLLREHGPEAVVDMHNTSGSGPSFGVCTHLDRQHDTLVSLFTHRLIVSQLRLGALMEISDERCPTVTIEVGGRGDAAAHALAREGLARYATAREVLARPDAPTPPMEVLTDPIRLELLDGVTLTYGDAPRRSHDITLCSDIERLNFGVVGLGHRLGWVRRDPRELFRARDAAGRCAVASLVRARDGELYPVQDLKLFMITNNAAIAQSDCLFYAVARSGDAIRAGEVV
jgi:hypothetical protein